jgi:hypothetical protein
VEKSGRYSIKKLLDKLLKELSPTLYCICNPAPEAFRVEFGVGYFCSKCGLIHEEWTEQDDNNWKNTEPYIEWKKAQKKALKKK